MPLTGRLDLKTFKLGMSPLFLTSSLNRDEESPPDCYNGDE